MNRSNTTPKSSTRWLTIFSLVFAGEMIFSLPFHVARFFRPTLLDVFNLTNTELGDVFAFYGIMAMIAYFPGGALADRFSARKLMTFSLLATGFGGIYFSRIPGQGGLFVLFGYWGVTTIFMFWAAMIKATREWGGHLSQGKAFGFLDGGRGLVAASAATVAVFIFSSFLPEAVESTSDAERKEALVTVIYFYTGLTVLAGGLVRFLLSDTKRTAKQKQEKFWSGMKSILNKRVVWLQAIIVVCAYSGYKALDFYSLYGVDVLGMNEVEAAQFVSNASYLRAVGAIGAGFIADRFSASKVILVTFGLLIFSYLVLGFLAPTEQLVNLILGNIIFTFVAVYALRGVYFALLEETKITTGITGTAVGLISVIGYTPDVFLNSLAGRILDATPGLGGYHHFYLVLAVFSGIGLLATFFLNRTKSSVQLNRRPPV